MTKYNDQEADLLSEIGYYQFEDGYVVEIGEYYDVKFKKFMFHNASYEYPVLHRENKPAIIYNNREYYFYHYGEKHNENGPAANTIEYRGKEFNSTYCLFDFYYNKKQYFLLML